MIITTVAVSGVNAVPHRKGHCAMIVGSELSRPKGDRSGEGTLLCKIASVTGALVGVAYSFICLQRQDAK